MAHLRKLPDVSDRPGRTQWELLLAERELSDLLAGRALGFSVALPKDTPLVDTLAEIMLRKMPAELADRVTIQAEHEGDPVAIAAAVQRKSKERLAELIQFTGHEDAQVMVDQAKAAAIRRGKPT